MTPGFSPIRQRFELYQLYRPTSALFSARQGSRTVYPCSTRVLNPIWTPPHTSGVDFQAPKISSFSPTYLLTPNHGL